MIKWLIILFALLVTSCYTTFPVIELPIDYSQAAVTRVVDGDTIEVLLSGEKVKVRYIGMDTPETVDPRKEVQYFGLEASAKNKELVSGKFVKLERDVEDKDRYGRLLRYVYTNDLFINLELIRLGYAKVATYPPNIRYVAKFLLAEKEARENKRGLWNE